MRCYAYLVCAVTLGCGGPPAPAPQFAQETAPAHAVPTARVEEPMAVELPAPVDAGLQEHSGTVPDLGTRTKGSDWPGFLGPFGTSVSPEKGIVSPWPRQGL